jgi:four helix bundle protein
LKCEHRTSNIDIEVETKVVMVMERSGFDLEHRLLVYAARVIRLVDEMPNTRANNHISRQLLRAGTSPLPNHGEAQSAESRADFVHKLKICLKELRESHRWLKLILPAKLTKNPDTARELEIETEELIRIFVKSVATARRKDQSWTP